MTFITQTRFGCKLRNASVRLFDLRYASFFYAYLSVGVCAHCALLSSSFVRSRSIAQKWPLYAHEHDRIEFVERKCEVYVQLFKCIRDLSKVKEDQRECAFP